MTNYSLSAQCWRLSLPVFASIVMLAVAGCGGGLPVAPVTGVVKFKGEPVKGGNLIFSPQGDAKNPGKSATGKVEPNGTYKLQTESPGDGALIGKHRISYTPPDLEMTEEQRSDPKYNPPRSIYEGLVPTKRDVEVKAGSNTIDIELKPR